MTKINKIISDFKRIGLNKYIYILGNVFISLIFIQCTTKNSKEILNQSFIGEYQGHICLQSKKIEPVKGDFQKIVSHLIIKNECSFIWDVDIQKSGKYAIVFSYAANEPGKVAFSTNGQPAYEEALKRTIGIYEVREQWYQFNCLRKKLNGNLRLQKGTQEISFTITPSETDKNFVFQSVELIPVSDLKKIEAQTKRIIVARADTRWFRSIPYGVMFHWTSESAPQKGEPKPFKEAVQEFNVEKFANMVVETGAGYVIFTIGHAQPYCPAPLDSWEKYHPGMTTKRDLIMELADELSKRNIKLICYLPTPMLSQNPKVNESEFMRINVDILQEMGNRYKEKISGYWFDNCQVFREYPNVSFEDFFKATKVGNPGRLTALNSWLYPSVTQWQDYWAGETYSSCVPPKSNIVEDGPGAGLQFHSLLALEGDWVYARYLYKNDKEIPAPVLDTTYLINLISSCKGKGPITLNVLIHQDGTISDQSMNVLKTLKSTFQKKSN
jgi:hypothetical protein